MVGYMSLEEQVDADFSRARRRAFLRRVSARLRKDPTSTVCSASGRSAESSAWQAESAADGGLCA
jgi:hypothetical protein